MICPNCKKEISNNSVSCKYCGKINYAHPRNRYVQKNSSYKSDYNNLEGSMKKMMIAGAISIVIVIIVLIIIFTI